MAPVGDDDAILGQEFAEAGGSGPRIEPAVGGELRAGLIGAVGCGVDALAPRARPGTGGAQSCGELASGQPGIGADESADPGVRRSVVDVDLPHLSAGGEELPEAHRELVERGSDDDGDIGLPDPLHRSRRPEPSCHAEVELGSREDVPPQRRRHRQRPGRVGELSELLRRSCQPCAAPGEEDRTLRLGEESGQTVERGLRELPGRREGSGLSRARHLGDLPDLEGCDVVGDREHHRHPVGQGMLDRGDGGSRRVDATDRVRAHADG
ncbi:Uncharacterised protein [Mycobacteroides abscessus subsp. abscessus]|nr:Uncharacterised protein [Mycobacteroides abscessus subsp. abscessus]